MNLSEIVSKSAPLLGGLLGSPLAGIGIGWIADIFGADKTKVQDILEKVTSDPESVAKLKQIELQYQVELEKLSASNYSVEVDDRKNARAREISLHDWVPTILAIGFLVNYALMQFYVVMHPASAADIISARFQDVLIMIISYYFGSSHKGRTESLK